MSSSPSSETTTTPVAKALLGLLLLATVVGLLTPLWQGVLSAAKPPAPAPEPTSAATANPTAQAAGGLLKAVANSEDYLALIRLEGPISSKEEGQGFLASDSPAMQALHALNEAAEDEHVKGVLLWINSPGGTVAMSQELAAAVTRVRAHKPVVASLNDLAASGGYYTAVAADRILANKGTLTGSIGVIIHTMNWGKLLHDKLGIESASIKSGAFKDILSPDRPMRPDEKALLQGLVNDGYQDFLKAVLAGRLRNYSAAQRPHVEATLRSVADGRVVSGNQAVAVYLADALGGVKEAEDDLRALAGERFKLGDAKGLKLEPYGGEKDWTSLLELGAASMNQALKAASPLNQLPAAWALGARYPKQPLWLYE